MKINRHGFFVASALSVLLAPCAFGQAQTQNAQSASDRLLAALQQNRLALTMSDKGPSGPGWNFLVQEARTARFTLIGEEHGVAETAQLSAALFAALREAGYSRMAIELSPAMAQDVETAARRNGYQGLWTC